MEKRSTLAAFAAALLALGMAGAVCTTQAMAAGPEGTDYEWSAELDCTLCHQKEAAGLGLMEAPEAEEGTDDADAVKDGDKADVKDAEKDEGKDGAGLSEEELARIAEVSAYAPMHAEMFKLDCATCHEDTEDLAKGHKKLNSGKEASRLKKSQVAQGVCTPCHEQEKLAEATEGYQGLTDTDGTTVNPHALPEVESHAGIACTDCHQVHSGKTIDATAMTTCNSCHHAGVFECGTCH